MRERARIHTRTRSAVDLDMLSFLKNVFYISGVHLIKICFFINMKETCGSLQPHAILAKYFQVFICAVYKQI